MLVWKSFIYTQKNGTKLGLSPYEIGPANAWTTLGSTGQASLQALGTDFICFHMRSKAKSEVPGAYCVELASSFYG